PWIDFEESAYRYRFQGTVFADRELYLSSGDAGVSVRYALPSNYGDVHVGVYNGEAFSRAETNDQKAFQARLSLRPFARSASAIKGLRATVFYDSDHYIKDADRTRFIGALTFEHPSINAGLQYLKAADQTGKRATRVQGNGYSVWATPRTKNGWEALLRYDRLIPNEAFDNQHRARSIAGLAYWLPHKG